MDTRKIDVLVVGELNVDLILNRIDSFPEIGKEKLAQDMTLTLGSSSAIFASNLSSLGSKVSFLGKIGNDPFGQLVIDSLNKKKVDTNFIMKDEKLNTGATIILNFSEDRAMVTYPGAMNLLTINDIDEKILRSAKHLHFSSCYLQPGIKNDLHRLFRLAKSLGLTTSFDMQWDPSEKWDMSYKEILPYVDVFLPNENELLNLTKSDSIDIALNKIKDYSNIIVVKMGSKGAFLSFKTESFFLESFFNNEVVDAIGAGDSFNAGFIFKFINKSTLRECLQFGNLMGAVNTTAAGGTTAFTNYNEILKIAHNKFGFNQKNYL